MSTAAGNLVFETALACYRKVGDIGQGGSGVVIRVQDEDGGVFALKYLEPSRATPEKLKRFRNELSFCSRDTHPRIIRIVDSGCVHLKGSKCPFYVMPCYRETLRSLITKGIPCGDVLPLFSQMLDGVEAAHLQEIWHRDLKPENVLFDPSATSIVVADFGIAHFAEEWLWTLVVTEPNTRLANFQYAAPEQREKGKAVDHRVDIYALGMILNEMFTRSLPLGTGFSKIASSSPGHAYLDSLVDWMMKQSPQERPASLRAVKEELIARRNEFVCRQELSKLRGTVIQESEVDDPLVLHPVTVMAVDYMPVDSSMGILTFRLSAPVNARWADCFRTMHVRSYLVGLGPEDFSIGEDTATIGVRPGHEQRAVDDFKGYLQTANDLYKQTLVKAKLESLAAQRRQVQARIEAQERRAAVLRKIRV